MSNWQSFLIKQPKFPVFSLLTGNSEPRLVSLRLGPPPLPLSRRLVLHTQIIDELGFVPLSKTGAELLFELVSQRYERSSTLITSNLPFEE